MVLSVKLSIEEVQSYVGDVFGSSMHQRRQGSLTDAAFGLLHSESLRIHSLGEGLARGKGLQKQHATKQVDRLLSNEKLCIWAISAQWVPYVLGERAEIMVAIDWTSFANDTQQCVCINLLTRHGRATSLLWKSMHQHQIKYNRAHYEDQLLSRLKEALPAGVNVTVIADRGFASAGLFSFIEHELGFDYIIRIQQSTTVTNSRHC